MQNCDPMTRKMEGIPSWVPEPALRYLAHIETGTPIRALARQAGCHASTVLRQVRAFEARRDDLLVDEALRRLGRQVQHQKGSGSKFKENRMIAENLPLNEDTTVTEIRLKTEACRILRRLCETGAVLAVSAELDKAAVVRETETGSPSRTAIVDREVAEAMALKDWITCNTPGRVSRYRITGTGRTALNHMMAEAENQASGFAEAQIAFTGQPSGWGAPGVDTEDSHHKRIRYNMAETPLTLLARRKDRDGQRFLSADLVCAGERLREDFELAQMGPRVTQNWDRFLTGVDHNPIGMPGSAGGSDAAGARVISALRDLGPGLGDVALRCCCYLEGLGRAEKRMGWSARSGKIVLRIALQRLKRHYETLGDAGGLIG